jgi:glycosyltransferase involved in cell wall biosynthesis
MSEADLSETDAVSVERQLQRIERCLDDFQSRQLELQEYLFRQFQDREAARQKEAAIDKKALAELTERLNAAAERLAELQNQLGMKAEENAALRTELERWTSVERSLGFRVLRKVHAIRCRLVPPHGRVERTLQLGRRAARKALRTAKSGAGSLRRRILRQPAVVSTDPNPQGVPQRRFVRTPALIEVLEPIEVRGLVSVVLPVYNHARLLREAIESVLAQTYKNFELIIVNDGSTDEIETVLADFAGHPQIRILTQRNQKVAAALDNGFRFARGEFWTWTSADNRMLPEQLEKMATYLQAHPAAGMVFADYNLIDGNGEPLIDPTFRPHNRYRLDDSEVHLPHSTELLNVVLDNFIGPCVLYRASVGRLVGNYDRSLGVEDYDYWMRVNMSFEIDHVDTNQPLYQYRVHPNCLSSKTDLSALYGGVIRLMERQRERAEFFDRPWTILADEPTARLLHEAPTAPHRILPWSSEKTAPDSAKRMIVVHANSLPAVAASEPPAGMTVAAWFDRDAMAPYRYRREIRQLGAVCFSREDTALERLGLATESQFRMGSAGSLLSQLVCYANNRAFAHATRTAEDLARESPVPLLPVARRLRILLQAEQFTQGGLEQVVIDLATRLDRERFDPLLLVLGEQGSAVEQARQRGIRVLALPKDDRDVAYRKMLIDERIDLVNSHFSIYGGYIAWQCGIPFVQTIHTSYVWLPAEAREQYRESDAFTAAYVCVSQSVAQYSDLKLGLPPGKMIVVPNGIDLKRFDVENESSVRENLRRSLGLSGEDFVFLNVAAIYDVKNQREMVHAFARALPTCPNAKLLFVGRAINEDYYAAVKRAIAELGLEKSVILAGHRDDVVAFYRSADAFLLPSFVEGWSLSLTEAACANLPIIATDVGGAADLLAAVGGTIIPPPYGSIANLTREALDRHAQAADPQFIERLADAMQSVYRERPRPSVSADVREKMSLAHTRRIYEQLFTWFIQGGRPDVARRWVG